MRSAPTRHGAWGSWRAFRDLAVCLVVLCVLVASGSKTLDNWLALTWIGLLLAGSLVLIWRTWKHRATGRVFLGQYAALPPRWRKWVLGETDDERD